jgi:UDP-glucuronate 4-epimerase
MQASEASGKELVLVTGCAGFIGSHLCEQLLRDGHPVVGLDNVNDYYDSKQKRDNLYILSEFKGFSFLEEDIVTTEAVLKHQPSVVVHIAGMAGVRPSMETPELYFRVNVEGSLHLLETSRKAGVKRFIAASSSSVYGDQSEAPFKEEADLRGLQLSPYALSKKNMEDLCQFYSQVHHLPTTCLRFFTVYGPRGRPDMFPYICLKAAITGEKVRKFGNGSSLRDYTYVKDIVAGIILAIEKTNEGFQVFNLGNNRPVTLNEFIIAVEKTAGKKLHIEQVGNQPGDVQATHACIEKASKLLGYKPQYDLLRGLHETKEWMEEQVKSKKE